MELIRNASIKDQAPKRVGGFVNSSQGLDEERKGASKGDDFDDALHHPGCELGPQGPPRLGVVLPGCVILPPGAPKGKARLGHDQLTAHYSRCDRVEWAEDAMPLVPSLDEGRDKPLREHGAARRIPLKADEVRHETGGESAPA